MLQRFRAAGLFWPTLTAIPALALLIGLGSWQWQRMEWKNDLMSRIASRASEPPLPEAAALELSCGPAVAGTAGACEYRRVRLTGRFDFAGERLIFAGMHSVDGRSSVGYWVFVPFQPIDTHRTVYVNRGFVPEPLRDPAQRPGATPTGDTVIVAQIRARERRGRFDGENDPGKNLYYVRDPAEWTVGTAARTSAAAADDGRAIGSSGYYLELVAAPGQTGFPRPLAGVAKLPNRHLEYALTWWGLALTLIGVYGSFAWSRLRMVG